MISRLGNVDALELHKCEHGRAGEKTIAGSILCVAIERRVEVVHKIATTIRLCYTSSMRLILAAV